MRRLMYVFVICGLAGVASADADPRAEMAAALTEQIDAHPAPAALPGTIAAGKVASNPASKHVPAQANLGRAASAAHSQAQGQGGGPPASALAHQAQAASASAAGQAQAAAAKSRHNPHH
jgi:hypothetical protein